MKRRIFLLLPIILVLTVLFFWVRPNAIDEKIEIYAFIPSVDNPFWLEVRDGIEREYTKHEANVELRILTANTTDAASQVEQLRGVLDRGRVDGIVFAPTNNSAPAPVIADYNSAGIPVVMIDTQLDETAADTAGARWDAFIGSDNRFGGRLAAIEMAKAMSVSGNDASVLLLKGSYVHQSAVDRAEGFLAGAKDSFVVIERDGEWSRQRATEITSGILVREEIDGIFASNDEMALGAVAALRELQVSKDKWPIIIGFDATKPARSAIADGLMFGSIRQQPAEMGADGLSQAIILARQGELSDPIKRLVPVDIVTRQNSPTE